MVQVMTALWIAFACHAAVAQDMTILSSTIYTHLANWPCVRLLNATHTVGCHSPVAKSGILFPLDTQADLDRFVSGTRQESFALVLPYNLLTRANVDALRSTGMLSGLIVLLRTKDTPLDEQLPSPDSYCPNCDFGLYAHDPDRYVWNPQAEGLLEEDFDFAMYALDPADSTQANVYNTIKQSLEYNQNAGYTKYPLLAVEFNAFMWAAVNSGTCLRRGWCQAVGGLSVFSSPSRDMTPEDDKPIIMVTAALDSRSLFPDMTIGLENDVSGLVTVLAVAEALSRTPVHASQLKKHILYTLFSGESWGFAGSQRFVQDVSTPFQCTNATRAARCPFTNAPCTSPCVRDLLFQRIDLNQIESIIEFQSVTGTRSNYSYFAHVDDVDRSQSLVKALKQHQQMPLRGAYEDGIQRKLPPSSAMSFLARQRATQAVVVSDFESRLGRYYSSDMDMALDLTPMAHSICNLATTTARTVYSQAGGDELVNNTMNNLVSANCSLVHSLLDCLVSNFSCTLMQQYFNVSNMPRISHSAAVYDFDNPQPTLLSRFAFSFLGSVTGQRREGSASCRTIQDCGAGEYCFLRQCMTSMTAYHAAYGTGLQYNESTGTVTLTDPTKAAWTESSWSPPTLRLFLVASHDYQRVELVVGVLWTVVSIIAVIGAQKYLRQMFKLD